MKPALAEASPTPGTPRKKTIAAGPLAASPATEVDTAVAAAAPAKPKRAPRKAKVKATPSELDRLQKIIVDSLDDDKAEDIVALDLSGKAMFCDRMVIATGLADRQISAMAQHLAEKLHKEGMKRVPIEGATGSDWVLIDAGDIVVHLFKPESRTMYGLERMWGKELDEAV